jgi:tetratricopeptide (TPR) repeat protein
MLSIIELLRDRPEHASRAKAIETLERLRSVGGLSSRQLAALGRLYEREGNWKQAKETLLSAVNSGGDDLEALLLFAELLLEHDEAEEAQRFIDRTEELIAKSTGAVSPEVKEAAATLRAKLLVRAGQTAEAAKLMEGLLIRPLPQNQLPRLAHVAQRMEVMGLYDATERLLTEYMEQDVRGAIALASFKGRRGDVPGALALLSEARKSQTAHEILSVAFETLRFYPHEVTPERCKMLEEWATSAMETEADKDRIKLLLAELYDLQARYDEVVAIYRGILADPKAGLGHKAIAQNNLAFVLAAVNPTPERAAEALELIDASIRILGPRADLLDTRAVAYLAQGKVDKAADDARIAAADIPSVAKYYHLAQVEKRLGNTAAARDAMVKAQELRGDHNPFTPAEREGFDKLRQELIPNAAVSKG